MNGNTVQWIKGRLPALRFVGAGSPTTSATSSIHPRAAELPAVFAVPESYLDKTSTWYAWGDISQKAGVLDELLKLAPSLDTSQNDDGTLLAGILDDKNLLGNALALAEVLYEQVKAGRERCPTSTSTGTAATASSAGASRATPRPTSRIPSRVPPTPPRTGAAQLHPLMPEVTLKTIEAYDRGAAETRRAVADRGAQELDPLFAPATTTGARRATSWRAHTSSSAPATQMSAAARCPARSSGSRPTCAIAPLSNLGCADHRAAGGRHLSHDRHDSQPRRPDGAVGQGRVLAREPEPRLRHTLRDEARSVSEPRTGPRRERGVARSTSCRPT